ncbi:MAG: HopJ type III effector protein [Alphaproteobacteria bacterium]|nr:HopJ type III effector protein [Alphaproteobacteria bacterium]
MGLIATMLEYDAKPGKATFNDVIAYIDSQYDFTPRYFTNGNTLSAINKNFGSQKIFSYAKILGCDKEETLALFCEHYEAVLANPTGTDHANIRNFQRFGWTKNGNDSVRFPFGLALDKKQR